MNDYVLAEGFTAWWSTTDLCVFPSYLTVMSSIADSDDGISRFSRIHLILPFNISWLRSHQLQVSSGMLVAKYLFVHNSLFADSN